MISPKLVIVHVKGYSEISYSDNNIPICCTGFREKRLGIHAENFLLILTLHFGVMAFKMHFKANLF